LAAVGRRYGISVSIRGFRTAKQVFEVINYHFWDVRRGLKKSVMPDRVKPLRSSEVSRSAMFACAAVALSVALGAGILIGRIVGGGEAGGERHALEARAFELMSRAMAPGSALACLDAVAGETFETSCEKAVFATPEATAAAVSYVAAQLALLAADIDYVRHPGGGSGIALAQLRRSVETDRFGIVAHVLSVRDGCTPKGCPALAMFLDPRRVKAHLAADSFGASVRRYAMTWREPAGGPHVASQATPDAPATAPQAPVASARTPNNYFYPSSDSIPAVSIMTPEPPAPHPQATAGSAESKPQGRSRPRGNASVGTGASASHASGPMQLTPGAQ
jgi:hypothetical protein